MNYEQAKTLYEEAKLMMPLCDECPHNWHDPQNACTPNDCMEHHSIIGILTGYRKALEDFNIPQTLAENRLS